MNSRYKSTHNNSSAKISNPQVFSRKPAETEDWAERWGLDGGLILTAGGDGISSNGGSVSVIVSGCVYVCAPVPPVHRVPYVVGSVSRLP